MDGPEAPGKTYEDWDAVMQHLLRGNPEEQHLALWKLTRLLTGFLGQLRAWDREAEWQDLRQTVLLKLARSYREGQLRDAKAFVSYARIITRNEFYDLLRARHGQVEVEEWPEVAEASPSLDEETTLSVRTALAQLPEHMRKVVQAVYLEDQTYEDAAMATGIPLGSLKRYLRQGLAQLKAQLAGTV